MAIVAIDQQLGSNGAELAKAIASRLGYRTITRAEIIADTAEHYHVTEEQLLIVDERRPHFWERLRTDSERLYGYFRASVLKQMARGDAVILGRSIAQHLPDVGYGLRVRAVAPQAARVKRIAEEEKLTLAIAEWRIRDHDREVHDRVMTLSGFNLDDPANYHLTVNLSSTPIEASAEGIATCVREIERLAPEAARNALLDVALTAQVRAALQANPKLGGAAFEVHSEGGKVRISGASLVAPWDEMVVGVVRQVEGVESVEVISEESPTMLTPA